MEKKLTGALRLIGGWFIISGALGVLSLLDLRAFYQNNIKAFQFPYSYIRMATDAVIPLFALVGGFYLIKLKEWGRKFIIGVCALNLLLILVSFIPFSGRNMLASLKEYTEQSYEIQKQEVTKRYKPEFQQDALQKLEQSRQLTMSSLPVLLYVLLSISVSWHSWVIFYLNDGSRKMLFAQVPHEDIVREDHAELEKLGTHDGPGQFPGRLRLGSKFGDVHLVLHREVKPPITC